MSLYRHLRTSLESVYKIALATCTFIMTLVLPAIAKADVIKTPRVDRTSSFLVMAAVSILVAVIGAGMIIRRKR